jgi:uncharacterized membrane protein YhiD involved in acid resistance
MAAGFGYMGLAVVSTALILLTLFAFDLIETWISNRRDVQDYKVRTPRDADSVRRVDAMFGRSDLTVRKRTYYQEGDEVVFELRVMGGKRNHDRMRNELMASDQFTLAQV